MLAQAVEGQRDEQREVVGVLGDMRNQLLRVGQELAEMRASGGAGADSADASTINNVTVELREAVRFLSERLDGVTRMVAQRGEELADIRGAMTAIDAHVRAQAETVGMLSQGLQALPSYGERVSALQENIDRVHQRVGEVRNVVSRPVDNSQLEQRLASLEAALAPISDHLTQSRQAAVDHSATLADQSATLAEQAAAMAEQRSTLDALHERIESLAAGTQAALAVPPVFDDTSIQALDVQLTGIATEITSIRKDMSGLAEAGGGGSAPVDTSEFSAAVAAAEERMRTHVDEAVVALAEMLLRRRMPAPSYDPIEPLPMSAPPVGSQSIVPPVVEPAVEDVAADIYEVPTVAADGESAAADLGADSPEWWERDDAIAAVAAEQPDDEAPVVDFSAADFADEDLEDDVDDDVGDEPIDAESDAVLMDGPPVEPAEAAAAAEPESEQTGVAAEDLDATSEIAVLDPEWTPAEAAPPPSHESRSSSWSPEVPAERPDVDPAGTIVPERKKRWFRG
jgi:uncharacterized coiled-coil protein SlyX/prefoldin subunit 5